MLGFMPALVLHRQTTFFIRGGRKNIWLPHHRFLCCKNHEFWAIGNGKPKKTCLISGTVNHVAIGLN